MTLAISHVSHLYKDINAGRNMLGNMVQNCQIYKSKKLAATFINISLVIIVQFGNTSIEKELKLSEYCFWLSYSDFAMGPRDKKPLFHKHQKFFGSENPHLTSLKLLISFSKDFNKSADISTRLN